jgi:hypothetical protein
MKWRAELMAEHESEDRFILTMMFALLIGYGCIANEIGSHLLGAFIAGMSFCWMQPALMLWHSQVKRIANWLIRLFFGATVAFSIPIAIMMDLDALWKVGAPLQENGLFLSFPYVCPEPVLVKSSFLYMYMAQEDRFLTCCVHSIRSDHSIVVH